MSDPWALFPFPTLTTDGFTNGSLLETHPDCLSCPTKSCHSDESGIVGVAKQCRYGITYARIDSGRTVNGIVATDHTSPTSRAKRRIRLEPDRRVKTSSIEMAVAAAREIGIGVVESFEMARQQMIEQLKSDPEMQRAIAAQFRRDAESSLNQSHDFLQLVKLVRGHAERLLRDRYPELSPEDAADQLPSEGAIYYSTTLMSMKVDSMLFIQEVNRAIGGESKLRIHPLTLKYVRIYNWQARQKNLKLHLEGESHALSYYNQEAIGAVVQGLLDNLVKYAPAGSEAHIAFRESGDSVKLQFTSLGPRIEPDERSQIFLAHYRAKAARKVESAGQGIGLATVKQISDVLGLQVEVTQKDKEHSKFKARYETTFSVTFRTIP